MAAVIELADGESAVVFRVDGTIDCVLHEQPDSEAVSYNNRCAGAAAVVCRKPSNVDLIIAALEAGAFDAEDGGEITPGSN